MNQIENKPVPDWRIAWKWAKWPTVFGLFVGFNFSSDLFVMLKSTNSNFSSFEEYLFRAFSMAYFAVIAGGAVFFITYIILKLVRFVRSTGNKA